MNNGIVKPTQTLPLVESNELGIYLSNLGLPSEKIIAEISERRTVGTNLPAFLQNLPQDVKKDARYLSKFTVAAAVGLFDASLNYIWNEVVLNLRHKAVVYGLEMFFDAAVGGSQRDLYKNEEDLKGIKDNTLINTCRKLELISEVITTKLHHILAMRNDIGASHPTDGNINGFELMGWLQVCVQDVLQDTPSHAAIQIKSFVENLKKYPDVLTAEVIKGMEKPLNDLSSANTDNLLNTVFGIYVSEETGNVVRKNIALFGPKIWDRASKDIRYKIGIKLDGYKNNLQDQKHKLGLEFFDFCNGNQYQSLESRIISLDEIADDLLEARYAWDNYYNEVPHIRKIISFIKKETDIPQERALKIIKNILICRIGKGISYCEGVSPNGKPLYDHFINMLGDENIILLIIAMHSPEVRAFLDNKFCKKQMVEVLLITRKNAVSDRVSEILDFLLRYPDDLYRIHNDSKYQELTKNHISWH
ncbi:hypothetical protein ACES2J_17165 [Bdellovibrio bacteriovorus]|uniref:hypothetical protein n=1 Tax=Bdellovibrio bacteriovorus TaxID=959 RepID=UPI0035A62425